jgi:NADH:ubiquinone oxidoreductase subunit E
MIDDGSFTNDITDSGFFGSEGGDGADALDPAVIDLVDELVANAPGGREGLLRVLLGLQAAFDRVSWRVQELVADRFGLSPAQVAGVVSFFPGLSSERRGRLHLEVCSGPGCWLDGGEEHLRDAVRAASGRQERLHEPRLAVIRRECLGICGRSPVVRVGSRLRSVTDTETVDLVDELLSGDPPAGGRR